jgi:hypothetical protein
MAFVLLWNMMEACLGIMDSDHAQFARGTGSLRIESSRMLDFLSPEVK